MSLSLHTLHDPELAAALSQLNSPPPCLELDVVRQALKAQYGIEGTLTSLHGERDQNFRVESAAGQIYALKIINRHETRDETAFLTALMVHVETGTLPVARVIPDVDGNFDSSVTVAGQIWYLRLVTWMEGVPLGDVAPSLSLCRDTGIQIARVARRLRTFDGAAPQRRILWDSSCVDDLADLTVHVRDDGLRDRILEFLGTFSDFRAVRMNSLRRQFIHNDYNTSNITADKQDHRRVSGLVDFGDACHAPMINELAVAASYQMRAPEGPIASLAAMTTAYAREFPLERQEIEALPLLVKARVVTRIILSEWRAEMFPDNAIYIRRNLGKAIDLLKFFDSYTNDDMQRHLDVALTHEGYRP